VRLAGVPMRMFRVLMSAGGMALRFLGVAVRMMMGSFVVMMGCRGVMGCREHVVLVGRVLTSCHD
jgi:hypothetical protein